MEAVASPYEIGKKAYRTGISIPAQDKSFMSWLEENTTGEVGTAIEPLKEWKKGFDEELELDLKLNFPENFDE
ncbi:hypothetical protein DC914_RS27200 [Vibrio parahaemolyticus]|uniref:hypothetical protein n=1 Tax=Vibrio parahaemolyticus TaxID=670 RepID=UPI0006A65300|nr:hypothetical protein [Vibrio parahaemolyticus]EGR5926919.1 hypothetical protein [Vibrio parahaemolyticus]EJG0181716.1 hypothetical protein [Vibrio parahaemolyticus]KOF27948.1 hypothetical protein ACX13_14930 [Vibrio parahaemolyticus]